MRRASHLLAIGGDHTIAYPLLRVTRRRFGPVALAHAPRAPETPEADGLTSRELLGILRGLAGKRLVGAGVVEVAPGYDHAEMTTVAAAHVAYELLALMLLGR